MKLLTAALVLCISSFSFIIQKDSKATTILNELSEKNKARKSIKANFTYSIKSDDINEEQKGILKLKGNKYNFNIFGVTKISDGVNICTISDSDEEIVISKVDYNDPDEFSPSEIFTIYQDGYKYRYLSEKMIAGEAHHVIELYPEADKNNPYRRITMYIAKSQMEIYKIEFFHKTSTKVFSITVNDAQYNTAILDKEFYCACDCKKEYDCDDQTGAK